MTDLIIFEVKKNRYAMNIENIQRIVQSKALTPIPNAHPYIEGMMSYEDQVIKILNFRKMVNLEPFDEELKTLFTTLKQQHKEWIDALTYSVSNETSFQKTTDPHACELGKWLDSFTSYDEHVSDILKGLNHNHKHLHQSAEDVLHLNAIDHDKAQKKVDTEIYETYQQTIGAVDTFMNEFDVVADSLQKLLIYQSDTMLFAIKVDAIVDIAHVEDTQIEAAQESNKVSDFLELEGVIELNDILINVIKEVRLPQDEE